MFRKLHKQIDNIASSKNKGKYRVQIHVDTVQSLPSSVKQVRIVWAKRAGGGVKAATDSCATHKGKTLTVNCSQVVDLLARNVELVHAHYRTACRLQQVSPTSARPCSTM